MSTESSVRSREALSRSLDSAIQSLSSVVNSASESDSALEKMSREMSDYEQIIDSDTFYKQDDQPTSSIKEPFEENSSTFSNWCIILLVIVFIVIGFLYFMKLRREKNKLKKN